MDRRHFPSRASSRSRGRSWARRISLERARHHRIAAENGHPRRAAGGKPRRTGGADRVDGVAAGAALAARACARVASVASRGVHRRLGARQRVRPAHQSATRCDDAAADRGPLRCC